MFEETAHVSTCTCSTHHFLRLLSGSTDQGSDMLTLYAFCMIIWVKITGGISSYNLMMMAHFSVTSAPFCSIHTMWVVISRDDCLTHFGGVKITYPYRKDGCISTLSVFDSSTFYMLLGAFYFFYTDSYLFCTRSTTWLCVNGVLMTSWLPITTITLATPFPFCQNCTTKRNTIPTQMTNLKIHSFQRNKMYSMQLKMHASSRVSEIVRYGPLFKYTLRRESLQAKLGCVI